jgi:phosphoserine phosphatase
VLDPAAARRLLPPSLVRGVERLALSSPGATCAFDADGTLWREDIGEAFLRHLVLLGLVRHPSGRDPYAVYEERVAQDKATGYAYAAQLQAGLRRDEVARVAAAFAPGWVAPRLIGSTQALVSLLLEVGLAPAVISASALEIVVAAAPLAGIPAGRCAAMTLRTRDGLLTEELVPPLTYARGKVEALDHLGLRPLALAAGDSLTGDLALLEAAELAVVVAPAQGSPLSLEAARRGWTVLPQEG